MSAGLSLSRESSPKEEAENSSLPGWEKRVSGSSKDKSRSDPGSLLEESISPALHSSDKEAEAVPSNTNSNHPQPPQLTAIPPITTSPPSATVRDSSSQTHSPTSPILSMSSSSSPPLLPGPNTSNYSSASHPRLSTSSSQIFERSVQEQVNSSIPPPTSPAIPAHIQTENRIPAVLEASSIAITDEKCDVDEVEIIMHSMHQPAVSVVAPLQSTATSSPTYETHQRRRSPSPAIEHAADESPPHPGDDNSPYSISSSAAAVADRRRLSFISFADVVQAEHAEHAEHMEIPTASSNSINNLSPLGGSPHITPADREAGISTIDMTIRRSPSPIRLGSSSVHRTSSGKSAGTSSPPRSNPSDLGMDRAELTIQTMGQALRKTGSGDLSGYTPRIPSSPTPPFGR